MVSFAKVDTRPQTEVWAYTHKTGLRGFNSNIFP